MGQKGLRMEIRIDRIVDVFLIFLATIAVVGFSTAMIALMSGC